MQVLWEYAKYGDAMIGRWHIKPDGHKSPSVRAVFKPLLNMFHSERGSKRWKQAVDASFKTATSVSGLLKVCFACHECVIYSERTLPQSTAPLLQVVALYCMLFALC